MIELRRGDKVRYIGNNKRFDNLHGKTGKVDKNLGNGGPIVCAFDMQKKDEDSGVESTKVVGFLFSESSVERC